MNRDFLFDSKTEAQLACDELHRIMTGKQWLDLQPWLNGLNDEALYYFAHLMTRYEIGLDCDTFESIMSRCPSKYPIIPLLAAAITGEDYYFKSPLCWRSPSAITSDPEKIIPALRDLK